MCGSCHGRCVAGSIFLWHGQFDGTSGTMMAISPGFIMLPLTMSCTWVFLCTIVSDPLFNKLTKLSKANHCF